MRLLHYSLACSLTLCFVVVVVVAQVDHDLGATLLPLSRECWDYRHVPSHLRLDIINTYPKSKCAGSLVLSMLRLRDSGRCKRSLGFGDRLLEKIELGIVGFQSLTT